MWSTNGVIIDNREEVQELSPQASKIGLGDENGPVKKI